MAPFVMEVVNSRVIHRSAALASPPYGADFKCACAALCCGALASCRCCCFGAFQGVEGSVFNTNISSLSPSPVQNKLTITTHLKKRLNTQTKTK
jgi:hypothetical protein